MGAKNFSPAGIRTTALPIHSPTTNHCATDHIPYSATEFILALLQSNRDHSKMKNESVKKSLEKSKNVLEEKRKTVKRKICIKKDTFTIIAMNCVQEQSINPQMYKASMNYD